MVYLVIVLSCFSWLQKHFRPSGRPSIRSGYDDKYSSRSYRFVGWQTGDNNSSVSQTADFHLRVSIRLRALVNSLWLSEEFSSKQLQLNWIDVSDDDLLWALFLLYWVKRIEYIGWMFSVLAPLNSFAFAFNLNSVKNTVVQYCSVVPVAAQSHIKGQRQSYNMQWSQVNGRQAAWDDFVNRYMRLALLRPSLFSKPGIWRWRLSPLRRHFTFAAPKIGGFKLPLGWLSDVPGIESGLPDCESGVLTTTLSGTLQSHIHAKAMITCAIIACNSCSGDPPRAKIIAQLF